MTQPRVPSGGGETIELTCGETTAVRKLDLGMREFECDCGTQHAVVMDVHPPERFLPEFLVEVLREAVETTSEEMPEFGTAHLLGIVLEEFPDHVAVVDVSDDGEVGAGIVWVSDFDSRRLHELIIELVIELMDHAVSHGEDPVAAQFESQMHEFDIDEFVEQYRNQREFSEADVMQ